MRAPHRARVALAVAAVGLAPTVASAGGYDTPMLYSARHMGMGGTAVSYVYDPSSLFHNPAGLAHTKRFQALADFSLLLAGTRASPHPSALDITSELTVAPMFLLGASYRVTPWLTLGAGVYPIASAGATYKYKLFGVSDEENRTRLVFIEGSPAASFNLPGNVRLGLGYRITYVSLERFQGDPSAPGPGLLDFKMNGVNLFGFRAGAQWTPLPWLQVGASYRHKVSTTIKNDSGVALLNTLTDIDTKFVLPSKLVLGARADVADFGFSVDVEHLWNSQNKAYPLAGTDANGQRITVPNVFRWTNAVTLRGGVEYRLLAAPEDGRKRLAVRAGYVYDGKTTNPRYPSAFGTPPGATQVFTVGAGWQFRRWQVNVAYAHRTGTGRVDPAGLAPDTECRFCGEAGMMPYKIWINGFYVDASFALD